MKRLCLEDYHNPACGLGAPSQYHLYIGPFQLRYWCGFLPRGGLPSGAEAAYVYDWLRQRRKQTEENRKKSRKLKKKIGKLSKKRKVVKRKEPNKIVKAIENVEKRIE